MDAAGPGGNILCPACQPVGHQLSGAVTDQPPLPGPWAALPARPSQLVQAEPMTHPARISEWVGVTQVSSLIPAPGSIDELESAEWGCPKYPSLARLDQDFLCLWCGTL